MNSWKAAEGKRTKDNRESPVKKDLAIIPISILLIWLMVSCSSSDSQQSTDKSQSTSQSYSAETVGTSFAVPDFYGRMHTMDEFIGNGPLIINFWGSWCPPCRREMPDLKRIYDEYKPLGLEIVGLAVKDTPRKAYAYVSQYGYDWKMFMATPESMQTLKLGTGVPTTIFFDRDGNEVGRYIGLRSYDDFKVMVEKII
jgi:thiol-disulfide isomerase/thioredoxin